MYNNGDTTLGPGGLPLPVWRELHTRLLLLLEGLLLEGLEGLLL
jgi:hypothetical protein